MADLEKYLNLKKKRKIFQSKKKKKKKIKIGIFFSKLRKKHLISNRTGAKFRPLRTHKKKSLTNKEKLLTCHFQCYLLVAQCVVTGLVVV